MDAPKGRYRVEEKDGRLTVIDTLTGAPAKSVSPSPRASAGPPPRPSGASSSPTPPHPPSGPHPSSGMSSPGLVGRYTRLLLGLVVKSWDADGRALVAWEWEQNGRKQRWDAVLGPAQQRRLGRALAAITAFPIFVLLTIVTGFGLTWLLLPIAFAATAWGIWSLTRLQSETGDS